MREQQRTECELLIRDHMGEEHRISLRESMSEAEIAETFRDYVE